MSPQMGWAVPRKGTCCRAHVWERSPSRLDDPAILILVVSIFLLHPFSIKEKAKNKGILPPPPDIRLNFGPFLGTRVS